ncbi:MAG: flagellar basal-body rod protein FlgF [Janthinobacterium lividum]
MDKLIYTAMSGASQALDQQASIANNLANASTAGFRAQLSTYRSVPLETATSGGATTRTFALTSNPGSDFTPGPIDRTGNPLDIAIQGDGWIAVQGTNGDEAYTRAGNLHVDQSGQLVNGQGQQIIGKGGPISIPPGAKIDIAADGTISSFNGGDKTTMTVIDTIKLVKPANTALKRGDDGFFRTADGSALSADATVQIAPGSLEGSNVNTVQAMVAMIDNARSFQMHMKMLDMASTNEQSANQLLNFSS